MTDIEKAEKYASAYAKYGVSIDNALALFKKFPDNVVEYGNSLCVFVRVPDEIVFQFKDRHYDMFSLMPVMELFNMKGDNVHVIACVGSGVRDIRGLSRLLKGKSISWFNEDMSRFIYFKKR